ncbi:Zinc finger MYM-type protein 4 [Oryzias melastigma]|uniref:Zinc finger MYM-type protein 4 n=1 Tax=Oryzias melastigma TaxID=30732 RepID=A0A834FDN2_ORYME|nr:Zinc finger MYM-type protein 4 [Oryzias melastigma]
MCDVCGNIYLDKGLTVTMEGCRKNICEEKCLVKFKKGVLTPRTCPTCRTSHLMSDMIENKDCEAELEFFCSHRCLMVHKAQTITISDIKSSSCNEEEVKPPLLNLNSKDAVMDPVSPKKHGFKIKEEQIDEDYNGDLPTSIFLQDVKDEPDVKKEDLKISSVFSLKEESKPAQPTSEQTDCPASCSACKSVLKDGETVYQRKGHADIFCSTSCLLKFYQNKTVKTCHFCLQAISQPDATLQILENNETTMKDFCSQSCLSSFNYKSIVSTEIPIAGAPSHSQCSVCSRYCISKHEVKHQEVIHKVCSDPCFHRFCNINSLSVCENCHACSKTPLMLKMEDGNKALCSSECLSQFKQKNQTPQQCSMCSTSALMSDMIPHKNSDGLLELFCTKSCLMASKIQGLSTSGTELNCNNCGTMRIPACHLSMSDSSIRSFCTLNCAMSFKEKHKDQNNAANSQGTSSPMEADLYSSPDKPACAQCRQTIHTPPTVIHYKEGVNFVCSPACSQEFKRINNIASLCEYCKNERLINEVKRVNNKDCCFCSEGCKILFHYELEKNWGKHCQSCTFCHSISKTVVTAHDDEKEFCSAECSFGYTSLQSHVSACDMCSHTGRLKESLPLLGEVKHFCDLKCLLRFCSKMVQTVHTGSSVSGSVGSGDSLPVITSIISLSNSVPLAAQLAFPDIQTKVVGHASIQTDSKELKNKSVFCVPLVHNKGVSCTVQTVEKQTQTVTLKEKVLPAKPTVLPLPLPVPVYVPLPMNMYSQITPQPVALPVLLPVPVFLPEKPDSSEQKLTPAEVIKEDFGCSPETETTNRTEPENHRQEEEQRQQTLSPDEASPVMLPTADDGDGGPLSVDPISVIDHLVADPDLQLASSDTENTVDTPLNQTPPPDLGLGTSGCHPPNPPPQKRPPSPLLNVSDKQEGPHNERTSQQSSEKASSRRPPCVKSKYGVFSWRKWIHRRKSKADVDHVSSSAVTLKADILGCSSSELNESLCLFIKEMTRRNGEPYSPDRLFYLCLCIQKYLFENMRSENIFSDRTYHKFSMELTRILKQFTSALTGSAVIRSCVEEEFLWDCKQLGVYSPITLLNTLLFFFCKYFHFTTVEQHLQLSFAQLETCTRSKDGRETAILRFKPDMSSNQKEPGIGGGIPFPSQALL